MEVIPRVFARRASLFCRVTLSQVQTSGRIRLASSLAPQPLLLRSALYTPGSRRRAVAKGRDVDADCLILDLEDAVAPSKKDHARAVILEELRQGGFGNKTITVRCNGLNSPWGYKDLCAIRDYTQDVNSATSQPITAVVLPKVENAAQVLECISIIDSAPSVSDGVKLSVWAMIETPRGVLAADSIAQSSPRLQCLVAGTSDLVKELHALHTQDRASVMLSLSMIILAARANNIFALDGVHLDLADNSGFAASCVQGRQLGFDGKTLVHPKTVIYANQAFSPTSEELEHARQIIVAHAEAEKLGEGVVVINGQLIENLHVENAHRLSAIGNAVASRGAAQVFFEDSQSTPDQKRV